MTPLPYPYRIDIGNVYPNIPLAWSLVIASIAVVFAFTCALVFGRFLYRAGKLDHPAPLIISLSMLTGVALLGALLSHDSDAYNLAAVGIGALAGSLAAVFRSNSNDHDDDDDDEKGSTDGVR